MKVSEIARYWAAKELTEIQRTGSGLAFNAPFATPRFTLRVPAGEGAVPRIEHNDQSVKLEKVSNSRGLESGTWMRKKQEIVICFDLPKGRSSLSM